MKRFVVWCIVPGSENFQYREPFCIKIKAMLDVNLLSVIVSAKIVLPHLKKIDNGKLILIGSEAGLKGGQKGSVYSATKFGLRGFAQSIREETAKNNIFVTVINPGMVRGKFFDDKNFRPEKSEDNAIEPDDIAKLVNYLLDEEKGMVFDEINVSQMKKVIDLTITKGQNMGNELIDKICF